MAVTKICLEHLGIFILVLNYFLILDIITVNIVLVFPFNKYNSFKIMPIKRQSIGLKQCDIVSVNLQFYLIKKKNSHSIYLAICCFNFICLSTIELRQYSPQNFICALFSLIIT